MSDINGGQFPQSAAGGSPIWPGTVFTGPLIAGNVVHSDGSGTLAGVGETTGTANQGYARMAQSAVYTQAGAITGSPIVIPAQSQITAIKAMVTTAFTGTATTFGLGTTASATAFTAASAVVTSGALGQVSLSPGTSLTQIANWDNVGNQDVQIAVTATNTGAGVFTLTVDYVQGINLPS